jgi:hypothetical protein
MNYQEDYLYRSGVIYRAPRGQFIDESAPSQGRSIEREQGRSNVDNPHSPPAYPRQPSFLARSSARGW